MGSERIYRTEGAFPEGVPLASPGGAEDPTSSRNEGKEAQGQKEVDRRDGGVDQAHATPRLEHRGDHGPRPIYAYLRFENPRSYTTHATQAREQAQMRGRREARLRSLGIAQSKQSKRNAYKSKWRKQRLWGDIRRWVHTVDYRPSQYTQGEPRQYGRSVITDYSLREVA